jgi:CheY-like chemotaxis protein
MRRLAGRTLLIIHERLGNWGRQIRPRAVRWPARVVETRSAADLEAALARAACPILLIDLGDRVRAGLEDLHRAVQAAPNALSLVLDAKARPAVALLARELGATHVLSGVVTPPSVVALLTRWLPLARRRAELDGWAGDTKAAADPLDNLLSSNGENNHSASRVQ